MHDPTPTATMPPVAKADRVDLVFVVDGRTLAYPLPAEGRVVVGRSAGDVVVAHASLSRQHAAITTPSLLLEDLGSTNGTWLRAPDDDRMTAQGTDEIVGYRCTNRASTCSGPSPDTGGNRHCETAGIGDDAGVIAGGHRQCAAFGFDPWSGACVLTVENEGFNSVIYIIYCA